MARSLGGTGARGDPGEGREGRPWGWKGRRGPWPPPLCSHRLANSALLPAPVPCICPLSIPTMLSMHSEQLHKTGFPTVHAVVLLEGTMNLTGETQPLVEQLMMVKRMQVGGQGGSLSPQQAGHAGQEGGFFWSSLGDTGFLLLCGG